MEPKEKQSLSLKKSVIGPTPEDWDVVRLGDPRITTFTPNKVVSNYEMMAFIPMDKIPDSGIYTTYEMRPKNEVKSGVYCEAGNLLLAKITPSLENGKQGIVPRDVPHGFAIATTEVFPIKCVGIDTLFCFYILKHRRFRQVLINSMIGATGRQRVPKTAVSNLIIPLPPLPEQKRIAEVLRTVDEAIEKVEQEIDHTERLKKGLMQRLLTHGIGHTRFKDSPLGKIPEDWEVVRLGDSRFFNLIMGQSPPSSTYNKEGIGLPFLQGCAEFGKMYPKPTTYCSSPIKVAKHGDILISVRAPVGEVNLAAMDLCIGRGLAALRANRQVVDTHFIYYFFLRFKRLLQNRSSGSTFKAITKADIENFLIPLPPLPEQKKIAEILMTVDRKIELLKNKKNHLERLKKGLMNDLLTGRRRLKVVSKV